MPEIASWLSGYWGIVQSAAAARMGSGALFNAINEERANRTQGPLTGVTAIQMGRVYSMAVNQRNATEAFSAQFDALQNATEDNTIAAIRNSTITDKMITYTWRTVTTAVRSAESSFSVRFEVTATFDGQSVTEWRYLRTVDIGALGFGGVVTLIQTVISTTGTTHDLGSFTTYNTVAFTGRAMVITL